MLAALATLLACVREPELALEPEAGDPFPEGAPVTITFSVPASGLQTGTKAIGEEGSLNSLHVAVFGSSGFLKEYVKAELMGTAGDTTYRDPYYNPDPALNQGREYTVPLIQYKVTLSLSEKRRIIHFIGNGPATLPFDADTTVMTTLMSEGGDGGFWQTKTLTRIGARKNADGQYINEQGQVITDGKGYVADDYTINELRNIPLVRNWAKISLYSNPEESNFEPKSFAVINEPTKGTIAPLYRASDGKLTFVDHYEEKTFEALKDIYPSSLPDDARFNSDIPAKGAFLDRTDPGATDRGKVVPYMTGEKYNSVYLYERPVPNERMKTATFVIVYGHYKPKEPTLADQECDCFYRIDLADNGEYYPVYRNFNYQIVIKKIESKGAPDPEQAAQTVGGVDISSEVRTSHLGDISDGQGRLIVQPWMGQSFHAAQIDNDVLSVKFFDDVMNDPTPNTAHKDSTKGGVPVVKVINEGQVDEKTIQICSNEKDIDLNPVTWEIVPTRDGKQVITEAFIGHEVGKEWEDGWRNIYFSTIEPQEIIYTQILRIKASYRVGDMVRTLHRDIEITVLPVQRMTVSCSSPLDPIGGVPQVANAEGADLTLRITIPDNLQESMFPLDFILEPEHMTLMPDLSNPVDVPVISGESISDNTAGKTTKTFQFVRTVTVEEYKDSVAAGRCHFDTQFVTTRAENETIIWVWNDFFYKGQTRFVNDDRSFKNLSFTTSFRKENGSWAKVPLHFDVDWSYQSQYFPTGYPDITLVADGITLDELDEDPNVVKTTSGNSTTYRFTPSREAQDYTCTLLPGIDLSNLNTNVSVSLSAPHYHSASIRSHHFRNIMLLNGHAMQASKKQPNVAFDKINRDSDKYALLGYCDDPDAPAKVSVTGKNTEYSDLLEIKYQTTSRQVDANTLYHEIEFRTRTQSDAPIRFTVTAPGYVENNNVILAERFNGIIGNPNGTAITKDNVFKTGNKYNFGPGKDKQFTYSTDSDKLRVTVAFSALPSFNDKGLVLGRNQEGLRTMTVETQNDYKIFYVEITFDADGAPSAEQMEVNVGRLVKYLGSNDQQYMWMLPENLAGVKPTMTFTGDQDQPVNITKMIIKSFKANQ